MKKIILLLFAILTGLLLTSTPALATHSWGGYHWARSANPFTLKLGDNLSSAWKPYLTTTSSDWSVSSVLDTIIVAGQGGKNCKAVTGRIEVCNRTYGKNGWLGIAQIYLSGPHITKATTKVNDTYFNTVRYNTPAWRNLVMCQEVGHDFGLDHQDEDFNNAPLGTCMDYTSDPAPNQHPNTHDYEQLESIYAHLDSLTTISQSLSLAGKGLDENVGEDPSSWGQLVRRHGRSAVYEKDFGGGQKLITHVFYAD